MKKRLQLGVAVVPPAGGGGGDAPPGAPPGPRPSWAWERFVVAICHDKDLGKRMAVDPGMPLELRDHGAADVRAEVRWNDDAGACVVEGGDSVRVGGVPVDGSRVLADGDRIRVGGALYELVDCEQGEARYHNIIYRLVRNDERTGLPNRRWFSEQVEHLRFESRGGHVLVVALDGPRDPTDRDERLVDIAALLTELAKPDELVGRVAHDELAVLVLGRDSAEARVGEFEAVLSIEPDVRTSRAKLGRWSTLRAGSRRE